jgi:YesN/AraC family two-component response regulator
LKNKQEVYFPMNAAVILLVDDDTALLQALARTISLRMSNVEVHTTDSAAQALVLLGQEDYDLVISDIKMPGMNGFDVLAFVSREYPQVPVMLITGHGEHDLAIQALRGGAYDYLQKPIDRDDFVAAVSRALHARRLRREVSEQHKTLELYALGLERLVEQCTREVRAAKATKEMVFSRVLDDLSLPLARLQRATEQLERHLLVSEGNETLEQSLTDMKLSLGQLKELAASVQDATFPRRVTLSMSPTRGDP